MEPSWRGVDDDSKGAWDYRLCRACGLISLAGGRNEESDLEVTYSPEYYGDGISKFTGAVQWLREMSAWRRAREVSRFFDHPGRVADIGCGEGLFLGSMKRLGWEIAGCEISSRAATRAENKLQCAIHRGEFETLPAAVGPFDVVMLWHVLEHVSKPQDLLSSIYSRMRSGGVLIVGIPNGDSWQARLFGPHWFHLDPPRHLHQMGSHHLRHLAERTGFQVQEIRHFSLEYNPYGWAQSFLNMLGFKRDAMYQTLKRGKSPRDQAFGWRVLAWSLLAPSILPAVLESLLGRGGTISAYLRKPE
jgi:2-polyprenyl-3-methyl-5-hydroxy-6-metoxy-1,4-benzoquinol methylase